MEVDKILVIFLLTLNSTQLFSQNYFENITKATGIRHTHVAPNLMGGGIAVFDYNNDGFEDLYFTGGIYEDRVFKNNGNKTFTDVSFSLGIIGVTKYSDTKGVISGDINNDGFEDVFVTTGPGEENILFINQEGESFYRIINSASNIKSTAWVAGASFGDYNLDGYLDIYLANYINTSNPLFDEDNKVIGFAHECYNNEIYVSNGDVTFKEMANELGVANEGCGLAVAFTDTNNDSYPDIYVANDFGEWLYPNSYYQNSYPKNLFSNRSSPSKLDIPMYGMGIGIGDVNNDGLLDYYITNIGKNSLMRQAENMSFDDIASISHVTNEKVGVLNSTSWGAEIFDFDHDGWEDIFVSNGNIGSAPFLEVSQTDPNKLFKNDGENSFTDVSEIEGVGDERRGRGMVTTDLDNDGDLDIVISNVSPVKNEELGIQVYENMRGNQKKWLKVKLKGGISNTNGLGARVICYSTGKIWTDEICGGSSHGSKKSNFAHFGLGNVSMLDSVVVIWPGGFKQVVRNVKTDQYLLVDENRSTTLVIGCMEEDNMYYDPNATYNSGCTNNKVLSSLEIVNGSYNVYPNPTESKLFVHSDKQKVMSVQLYSVEGQLQMSENIPSGSELDLSRIKAGIYFINIDNRYIKKILLK